MWPGSGEGEVGGLQGTIPKARLRNYPCHWKGKLHAVLVGERERKKKIVDIMRRCPEKGGETGLPKE